jgi:trehalose/maltose hydrolase-like predicted phosphorylase
VSHWLLTHTGYDENAEGLREALCTLGNGYFGTRGAAPESTADGVHYPGTYVAGGYNRMVSEVAGRHVENEDLVNMPNWLPVTFRPVGGEWFDVSAVDLLDYRQELDMRRGTLTRLVRFRDRQGRVSRLAQRRIVSMDNPHLACLETTIVPEGWSGRIEIRAALDGRVSNEGVARYRDFEGQHLRPLAEGHEGDDVIWLQVQTSASRIRVAQAARIRVYGGTSAAGARGAGAGGVVRRDVVREDGYVAMDLAVEVEDGAPVTLEKTVAIFTSRDRAVSESLPAARAAVIRAGHFDALMERHALAWRRLWQVCHITMDGDEDQALNLYIFHVLQTLSGHVVDLDVGMPARGLHGEAYRGHVFWDELFVFPFLNLHFPETARALLMYRWRRLSEARWAARQEGHTGAMYPWQSGSDGRDETQRVHLNPISGRWLPDNSRLQRHIGLAVAYNTWQYYQATDDLEFLSQHGAEMLLEIARFFSSITNYNRALDRYEIRGVVGPDEYHDSYPDASRPGLDNNAYTNVMAVWVMLRALDTLAVLPESRSYALRERLRLSAGEVERFEQISRKMRVVFHGDGVISQFEGYDRLAELNWDLYRSKYGDIRRLDRVLEAEGESPNRYQASKQADVLMLLYLLSAEELSGLLGRLGYDCGEDCFDRTIDYYLPRTSNGSTLSAVVNAWVLARRDREASWEYFREALRSDIGDVQGGTTCEGVHLGAMAGTIDLVHRCYTGMELREGKLYLDPLIPREIVELAMEFQYRGHRGIQLTCWRDRMRLGLRRAGGPPIDVCIRGRTQRIEPGGQIESTY